MVLLLAPLNAKNEFDKIIINASNIKVEYFCGDKVENLSLNVQSVGYGSIISCDYSNRDLVKKEAKNIQGVSYYLNLEDFNLIEFLIQNQAKIVSKQDFDNIKIIYALSSNLKKVIKDEKNFNLEIAMSGSNVTIGYPLIMGSY